MKCRGTHRCPSIRFPGVKHVVVGLLGLAAVCGRTLVAEEVEISLANHANDALIEFVPPPPGSPDRTSFTREGLLVQQKPDVRGRPTASTGIKCLLPASGDFAVTLSAKIIRLQTPSKGWGQGLIFAVFLDDADLTAIKFNYIATREGTGCLVEVSNRDGEPVYQAIDVPFSEGELTIAREQDQAVFSIDSGGGRQEHLRLPCPTADVRSVEVWCSRMEQGNARAEILLKGLHLHADEFYAFQVPQQGWFTWFRAFLVAQCAIVLGLLAVLFRQRS